MRRVWHSLLIIAAFFVGGIANEAKSGTTSIVLEGKIDRDKATQLSAEIARHPKNTVVLTIQSAGGDSVAAMDLGDTMSEFGVRMVIRRYCHSACSQYLMPSASSVTILDSASVAFHGTPSWLTAVETAPEALRQTYRTFKARERAFLIDRGIDYQSWLWVQQHKMPLCWFKNTDAAPASVDRFGVASRFHIVSPSRDVFEQLGFQGIEGNLPTSAKQAWDFAVQNGFRETLVVSYVPIVAMSKNWDHAPLSRCDDKTREQAEF